MRTYGAVLMDHGRQANRRKRLNLRKPTDLRVVCKRDPGTQNGVVRNVAIRHQITIVFELRRVLGRLMDRRVFANNAPVADPNAAANLAVKLKL